MKERHPFLILIALSILAGLLSAACALSGRLSGDANSDQAGRPTPTTAIIVFTATPTVPSKPVAATPTTAAATPRPPAEWPKTLTITEAQIEQQAAQNTVPGLAVTGLDVAFGQDAMTVYFATLTYSILSLRDVTVEGHFEVANGDVNFVADRIDPNNLATGMIPGFVNQALDQQLGNWYVESMRIEPGQLVAQVRPK